MINNNMGSPVTGEPGSETPCLLQNERGVCVLYKERYLYSKYDPSKSIKNIISNLSINPDTLILIFSPVLWYGLEDLLLKLPQDCRIAAIEYDEELFYLAQKTLNDIHIESGSDNSNKTVESLKNNILFFNKNNIKSYLDYINNNHFKKVLRLDFSGGIYFNRDNFEKIYSVTQSVIDQYLKNKLTLIKFGRLFSKNIFKNLKQFDTNTFLLQHFEKTIDKPILVLGAGESLNQTIFQLKNILKTDSADRKEDSVQNPFFILAVDQALTPLLENGIKPDAVVAVEAQLAIEKAYIGKSVNSNIPVFLDLVSRRHVSEILNGKKIFYLSDYSKKEFLKPLSENKLLGKVIRPLGSVGLVATEIALFLRKDNQIPVYISGLDFSYSAGITHAKGTVSHKRQLSIVTKLKSIFNFEAAFTNGTTFINDKSNNRMITSASLSNYAKLFTDLYADEKNIYDSGFSGHNLGLEKKDIQSVQDIQIKNSCTNFYKKLSSEQLKDNSLKIISGYLENEKKALEILKDILTFGDESKYREDKTISLAEQIDALILPREYLYLHFPDTPEKTNRQSFLNRVRIETDFFLKELK
ncbi:MAG: motility associated factor glycosyltransferase family protein [Treponema sp.]|nr:motility associated factor glycosyltransferase family protein [Candidatus Treponema merdequi]